MSRSRLFDERRRAAEIAAYGAPTTPIRFAGKCGCGCGTKFRAHAPGELVRWFGSWVLVPCVRRQLDARHAWSSRMELALRLMPSLDDDNRSDRRILASRYLYKRMARACKELVRRSVLVNQSSAR